MSTLSVDMIEPVGSTLTLGQSGDTVTIPAGGTFTNSGTATGFGGIVKQVLEDNLNTTVSSTSTTYIASGLSIAITPANASSKFLLTLSGGSFGNTGNGMSVYSTFYVDGAEVSDTGPYERQTSSYAGGGTIGHSAACLHSPATASAVTYTVYYKVSAGTGTFNASPERTVFTVMEISS
jgi:hypothetical protein